jgi:hypothetical protein
MSSNTVDISQIVNTIQVNIPITMEYLLVENTRLKTRVRELENQLDLSKKLINEITEQRDTYKLKFEDLQKENEILKTMINELTNKVDKLTADNITLHAENKDLSNRVDTLTNENKGLTIRVDKLTDDNKILHTDNKQLTKNVNMLMKKYRKSVADNFLIAIIDINNKNSLYDKKVFKDLNTDRINTAHFINRELTDDIVRSKYKAFITKWDDDDNDDIRDIYLKRFPDFQTTFVEPLRLLVNSDSIIADTSALLFLE